MTPKIFEVISMNEIDTCLNKIYKEQQTIIKCIHDSIDTYKNNDEILTTLYNMMQTIGICDHWNRFLGNQYSKVKFLIRTEE